jgi:mRNA-degrading endonuclease RelE of RelBE toxin-antitoxin system
MLIVKTTKVFDRAAKKILSDTAMEMLFDHLLAYPKSGDVISGTGGVRKLRWQTGKDNKGKRGGVRVIYFYQEVTLVILITLYAKACKRDLTQGEKRDIKDMLPVIISEIEKEIDDV